MLGWKSWRSPGCHSYLEPGTRLNESQMPDMELQDWVFDPLGFSLALVSLSLVVPGSSILKWECLICLVRY